MLSVNEALQLVLEHAANKAPTGVAIDQAHALVLAEDVAADIDSPPHDKAMVDGYAVRSAELAQGRAKLVVLEEVTAGAVPTRAVEPGQCTRVMTGAPVPAGADAVVMHERTTFVPFSPGPQAGTGLGTVEIHDERFRPDQNIMRRGDSFRAGEILLNRGTVLTPADIGVLAEVGRPTVSAIPPPAVAILATGNELVPAGEKPGPGQIRNSNGPLLLAAALRAGARANDLGIARDDSRELQRHIRAALESDIVLLSGGVSAGVLDLVPGVLAELGVREVFHKVRLKPGKPLWFGVTKSREALTTDHRPLTTLVFGLPGNPVSSLVCFELFVRPAIARLSGRPFQPTHPTRQAKLTRAFNHRGDRPTYHPARLTETAGGLLVEPTQWIGSADLRGFAGANALALFPAGDRSYQAGDSIDVLTL